jgi:hypothetical protein
MAAQVCPSCGGSNPAGAAFCQYCGRAIGSSTPSAPLPTYSAPEAAAAPMPWAPGAGSMAPPPRRRSRWMVVLVVVVVVILVIGVASFFLVPPAPSIQVTEIDISSSDNVCDLDQASGYGFNASTGDAVSLQFDISGPNATSGSGTLACTISTLSTDPPGFNLTATNVPLYIPANETVVLSFTVLCPNTSYTGPLTLLMT